MGAPSLKELGLSEDAILTKGEFIVSIQLIGMVVGGVLWGIIGDVNLQAESFIWFSILLYSVANCNGFVQDVNTYMIIRFIAGVG